MMRTRSFLLAVLFAAACGDEAVILETELDDDRHPVTIQLEGAEVTAQLDADGVSPVLPAAESFLRLGLLWDDGDEGGLEVRTSGDGAVWSDWLPVTVVQAEAGAHVGYVEIDGEAAFFQYRILAGAAAPTFVAFAPLGEVGPQPDAVPVPAEPEIAELQLAVSTPIGSVTIHSRSEWGARAPKCISSSAPNRVTIHHTVTPTNDSMSPQARLRQIQSFHMDVRGWCDIGYNYLVSRDGRVWRGRGAKRLGAHVSNNNSGNVGISFMGTHTSTAPTSTQMCNTARLIRKLHMDFPAIALTRTDVKGHRQYGGTSCPGDALYDRIGKIVRKSKYGCSAD